jgi:hypothetical protein
MGSTNKVDKRLFGLFVVVLSVSDEDREVGF